MKAARPAIKGISIYTSAVFGVSPSGLRSFGFSARAEVAEGFPAMLINRGIDPMVLEAASTARSITRYRQNAFLPVNDDSR